MGATSFLAEAFWWNLGSNRFAPDFAPLRCATPVHGLSWLRARVLEASWAMSMDGELQKHYAQLLGIGSPWEVKTVELKLKEKTVEIELGWQWGAGAKCPECG